MFILFRRTPLSELQTTLHLKFLCRLDIHRHVIGGRLELSCLRCLLVCDVYALIFRSISLQWVDNSIG